MFLLNTEPSGKQHRNSATFHNQAVSGTTMRPMMRTFFTLPHQTRRLSCSASLRKELADSLSTWLRLTSTWRFKAEGMGCWKSHGISHDFQAIPKRYLSDLGSKVVMFFHQGEVAEADPTPRTAMGDEIVLSTEHAHPHHCVQFTRALGTSLSS